MRLPPVSCASCPEPAVTIACHNVRVSSRREFLASACALLAGAGCIGRGGSSGAETFKSGFLEANQTLERHMTIVAHQGELPMLALSDFHVANGVTVTPQYVPSDDELQLRLAAGGFGTFDVIVVGGQALASMIALNQLEPLAGSLVPNLDALQSPFNDSPFDSGLQHSAPACYDVLGIAVSRNAPLQPASWSALFEMATKYPGSVVVPDRPNDVIGAILVTLGHAWDSDSTSDLNDAAQRLETLLPVLQIAGHKPPAASGHTTPPPVSARGQEPLAYMASSREYGTLRAGVRFLVPSEGTSVDVRSYCIPIYAPHPVAALAWINNWLEPSIEAGAARELRRAVPLSQARPLMHPGLVLNEAICPPLTALAKSIQPSYSADGTDRRARIWSELIV